MKLKGYIGFQKKVTVKGQTCYGCTRANKDKFSIRIASDAGDSHDTFIETIFHELFHLGFFVIMACTHQSWTEDEQHEVFERIMPIIHQGFRKHAKGE